MHSVEDLRRLSVLLDDALGLPEDERQSWLDTLPADAGLSDTQRQRLPRHATKEATGLIGPVCVAGSASRLRTSR